MAARLRTLQPRVRPLNNQRLRVLDGGGPQSQAWRADKSGANARGYTYEWQQATKRFLNGHPLCAHCHAKGRVSAATVVDHVVPHRGDESKFWNEQNWQPMCKPCHDRKTRGGG